MDALERLPERTRRVRRFERRARSALTRIEITGRDELILKLVAEYRFLRSRQVSALLTLIGWSDQHTERRLRHLYDRGFLDRPEEQWAYYPAPRFARA